MLLQVDEVSDRFEAALRAGERPRITLYLTEVPGAVRRVLLRELLALQSAWRSVPISPG
jgi:hypothetical protein